MQMLNGALEMEIAGELKGYERKRHQKVDYVDAVSIYGTITMCSLCNTRNSWNSCQKFSLIKISEFIKLFEAWSL